MAMEMVLQENRSKVETTLELIITVIPILYKQISFFPSPCVYVCVLLNL